MSEFMAVLEKRAKISEIFSSLQGEGIYVGEPMIFIRFAGCNLACAYCDTIENYSTARCMHLTVNGLKKEIAKLSTVEEDNPAATVSITGGEPLLQADYLCELLPLLKQDGWRIYLETNGTLPEELSKVVDQVDIIAMDIKFPSTARNEYWNEHTEFLRVGHKKIFVKIVLTDKTEESEVEKAVELLTKYGKDIPLVLQPVTPCSGIGRSSRADLYLWEAYCQKHLRQVHIISQMQKIWQIR